MLCVYLAYRSFYTHAVPYLSDKHRKLVPRSRADYTPASQTAREHGLTSELVVRDWLVRKDHLFPRYWLAGDPHQPRETPMPTLVLFFKTRSFYIDQAGHKS